MGLIVPRHAHMQIAALSSAGRRPVTSGNTPACGEQQGCPQPSMAPHAQRSCTLAGSQPIPLIAVDKQMTRRNEERLRQNGSGWAALEWGADAGSSQTEGGSEDNTRRDYGTRSPSSGCFSAATRPSSGTDEGNWRQTKQMRRRRYQRRGCNHHEQRDPQWPSHACGLRVAE